MKTPEERLTEALRKSETKLQLISESSKDYITILDLDFKIRFINRIELGFSEADMIGIPLYNFLPRNQQSFVKGVYEEVVEERVAKTYETYFTKKEKDPLFLLKSQYSLMSEDYQSYCQSEGIQSLRQK